MQTKKMMHLRKATFTDSAIIWDILQQAIEQRRIDGSNQWQNGYPNEQTILDDINKGYGFVLIEKDVVIAYASIIFGIEPAYNELVGKWLSYDDYAVVHRVAVANTEKGKGIATHLFKIIEDICIAQNVFSIKVDTNFDNFPMMKILDKLAFTYCGEVMYNGFPRKAYEKLLPRKV